MTPSDSMTERAGPGRSVAPTIAIERGFTSGSSCMRSPRGRPISNKQREQHPPEPRSRQQDRDHGNNEIELEADRLEHLLRTRGSIAAGDEARHSRLVARVQAG